MSDSLKVAKGALDQGLITAEDFESVKTAFLRSQQIKAGFEAGFLKEDDYVQVKSAYLQSLQSLSGKDPALQNVMSDVSRQLDSKVKMNGTSTASASARQASQAVTPPPAAAAASQLSYRARVPNVPTNIPKMSGIKAKTGAQTSMSGISVAEDAVNLYYYLKAKSTYRWATWRINDAGNQVIIADAGDKDASYGEFLSAMPDGDCRYGVYDYQFTNSEGCLFNKLVFFSWAPDSARVKNKMMYASTKDFFKGYLDGLSIELQASDLDDLKEQDVGDAVRASVTRQ